MAVAPLGDGVRGRRDFELRERRPPLWRRRWDKQWRGAKGLMARDVADGENRLRAWREGVR